MAKRAALYARVSGDDTRKDGRNLAGQIAMCREHALKKGWRVVAELAEDERGATGVSLELPQLNRLREMARNREIDVIVVREIDRFSRTLAKQLIVEEEMKRCGVEIEYVLGEYPDTPEGNLNKNLKAVIAEYERVKIAERSHRGRRLKVKQGHVLSHGHRPYGYIIEEVSGQRTLKVHEPEARIVRLVYEWYTVGDGEQGPLSIKGITNKLTEMKVPTYADVEATSFAKKQRVEGAWAQSSVRNMLSGEIYAGIWHYGKRNFTNGHWTVHPQETWVPVEVPSLVSRETWEAAQARRAQNFRPGRSPRYLYLMRGRLFCAECKSKLQADGRREQHAAGETLYQYYVCRAHRHYATACSQTIGYRSDIVDALTWNWVRTILSDPDELRRNLMACQASQKRQVQPKLDRLDVIDDLIQGHSAKLQKLLDIYLEGSIEKDVWIERKQRLEQAIAGLKSEQTRLKAEIASEVLDDDVLVGIQAFTAEIAEGLATAEMDLDKRIRLIERLGVTGTIATEDGQKILNLMCYVGKATFRLNTNTTIGAGIRDTSSYCTAAQTSRPAA